MYYYLKIELYTHHNTHSERRRIKKKTNQILIAVIVCGGECVRVRVCYIIEKKSYRLRMQPNEIYIIRVIITFYISFSFWCCSVNNTLGNVRCTVAPLLCHCPLLIIFNRTNSK